MTREIKFRAWDAYGKEMLSWERLGQLDEAESLSLWNVLNGLAQYIIPMQSTGLTDRNGREIFEGDIVRAPYMAPDAIAVVFWPKESDGFNNGWKIRSADGWTTGLVSLKGDTFGIEVIGNVHESPEMLK